MTDEGLTTTGEAPADGGVGVGESDVLAKRFDVEHPVTSSKAATPPAASLPSFPTPARIPATSFRFDVNIMRPLFMACTPAGAATSGAAGCPRGPPTCVEFARRVDDEPGQQQECHAQDGDRRGDGSSLVMSAGIGVSPGVGRMWLE